MRVYSNIHQYNLELEDETKVRKYGAASRLEFLAFMEKLCNFLIQNPDPTIVPVYEFKYEGHENGIYRYSYLMERMFPLSQEERELIQCASDGYYRKILPSQNAAPLLKFYKESHPELFQFMEQTMRLGRYGDIHSGNFMVDSDNQYRIIDLEGFYHQPIDHPTNMWFQNASQQSANSL